MWVSYGHYGIHPLCSVLVNLVKLYCSDLVIKHMNLDQLYFSVLVTKHV